MINVNPENYQTEVLDSDEAVLVKLGAEWCGPCKMLDATIKNCEEELGVKVVSINIDEAEEITHALGVRSVPSLRIFKGGEVIGEKNGALSKSQLMAFIDNAQS